MNESKVHIKWVGSKITPDKYITKHAEYYQSVIINEITINVGDHVLITKVDYTSYTFGTEKGCDVAQVLYLYESTDELFGEDKYRAIVQWYSKPQDIPHRLHTDDIVMDFEHEVVLEYRPFDDNVSIETFFKKCYVINGDVTNCATEIIEEAGECGKYTYACRFALCKPKHSNTRYSLIPVSDVGAATEETGEKSARSCTKKNTPGCYVFSDEQPKIRAPRRRRTALALLTLCDEAESPRTPDKSRLTLKATPKSSKLTRRSTRTSRHDIENSGKETWSIKRKSTSKLIRDITNSAADDPERGMSPEIPIVSPIKLVNLAKLPHIKNADSKPLKPDDITAELDSDDSTDYSSVNRNNPKRSVRKVGARRNLNASLNYVMSSDEEEDASKDLSKVSYSVVLDEEKPIKIKLRVSGDSNNGSKDKPESTNGSSKTKTNGSDTKCAVSSPMMRLRRMNLNNESSVSDSNTEDQMQENTPTTRSARTRRANSRYSGDFVLSPTKQSKDRGTPTGSGRPKRNLRNAEAATPQKTVELLSNAEKYNTTTPVKSRRVEELQETPKRRRQSAPKTPESTPGMRMKQFKAGLVTPTMETRETKSTPSSNLNLARERLHVSAVPKSLPCRENEFNDIFSFIQGKILDYSGGCMYISGVPGTGKTATVTEVIKCLQKLTKQKKLPNFDFIEINGMRLTEPRQAYVHIYRQLEGKTVPWEQAQEALNKKFTSSNKSNIPTVLLVDELDILCTKRQDVVYTILDWPSKANAKLIVVTIANTMDLPERLLRAKVTSRLGLTRRTFAPYSHKQLMDIVMSRLAGIEGFNSDAVQLVARKVAAVSGDARRALDICRRATEIAEYANGSQQQEQKGTTRKQEAASIVSMVHVNKALSEMISSAKVTAIQNCSALEKVVLQAVAAEVARTGVEETTFGCIYQHVQSLCALEGLRSLPSAAALAVCCRLGARRLLITESGRADLHMKVLLNVGTDDLHYALQVL